MHRPSSTSWEPEKKNIINQSLPAPSQIPECWTRLYENAWRRAAGHSLRNSSRCEQHKPVVRVSFMVLWSLITYADSKQRWGCHTEKHPNNWTKQHNRRSSPGALNWPRNAALLAGPFDPSVGNLNGKWWNQPSGFLNWISSQITYSNGLTTLNLHLIWIAQSRFKNHQLFQQLGHFEVSNPLRKYHWHRLVVVQDIHWCKLVEAFRPDILPRRAGWVLLHKMEVR